MALPRPQPPGRSPVTRRAAVAGAVVVMALMGGVSVAICWTPAQHLWRAHVIASWPIVQGEVGAADIVETHSPQAGKRAAWDGWCVRWNYAYDWRGERFHGRLVDPTPSLHATGCFAYRAGAEQSAQRHPPGSAIALRVDPAQPQESSALPAESQAGSIVAIVFGLLPGLLGIGAVADMLRDRRRPGV